MSYVLELRSVFKSYVDSNSKIESAVLKNINLKVANGEKVAIMGPSGEGKSTLLNIIIGAHMATSGSIIINGNDFPKLTDSERDVIRAKDLGIVYQHHNLIHDLNVSENISLAQMAQGYKSVGELDDILNRMGILKYKNYNIDKLSGGQRQRTAIARAMCGSPSLIVADEPTGNLDSSLAKNIAKELFDIECSMVLVTHDRSVAEMADSIYQLRKGELNKE